MAPWPWFLTGSECDSCIGNRLTAFCPNTKWIGAPELRNDVDWNSGNNDKFAMTNFLARKRSQGGSLTKLSRIGFLVQYRTLVNVEKKKRKRKRKES